MMWRLTPHIHSWADLSKNYNITFNVRQYGSFWVLVWPHTHHLVVIVQSLSRVQLFVTPWTAARQATLSLTISWSLPKFMFIESVMPSNHLILFCPLLLPSIFPSIRVFSNESALLIRWPKYWSFSFSISPSNKYSRLIFFRIDWFRYISALKYAASFISILIITSLLLLLTTRV